MKLSLTLRLRWVGALITIALLLVGGGSAEAASGPARAVTGAISFRNDLDPQVAWSNYSLNVVYDTYIPLLTYRHADGRAGSEVIPGLARGLPQITDHGRTYTLYLRNGLRYSDGEPVMAADFRFAVERLFRLASIGGYTGAEQFFRGIVGARRFEWTGRGGIPGVVADDGTGRIVIHLVKPERSFTRKLAMTFAAPVPRGTPIHDQSFTPPPATGPYVITHSTRRGWTYERNPEWRSHDSALMPAIPSGHLDTIKMKVVHSAVRAAMEVERGKLDWASGELPAATLLRLSRRFPSRVRLEPTLSTEYFWLDTSKPPFDDVRVRRAVNYAVDRKVFSLLAGGQVSPTQQILPPDMPGYRKLSLYPHDMAKARRLIAAANPSVRHLTLWTYVRAGALAPAEWTVYLAAVLDKLGFDVQVKAVGVERYFELAEGSRGKNLDAGVGGWFANYPDPDDYFRETLGSRPTVHYNQNLARLFVPSLRRVIDRLETRPGSATPGAGYAALDRAYMRLAPWVPIGNIREPLIVSRRIDLGKVISNPSFGVDLTSLQTAAH